MSSLKSKAEQILNLADVKINGNRPWDIQVYNEDFYKKIFSGGSLSLGESYMDGWWDCKNLDEFFNKVLAARLDKKLKPWSLVFNVIKAKTLNMQNKSRSKEVAEKHYDLGNDFYKNVLDKKYMQYTCGYWKNAKNLDQAQKDKLELVCKKLNLKKTDKVLELGCGWGGFAEYAARKYGCHITAYNISEEQVKYARENCKGLPVEIIKSDYRNAKGTFDKVVSIGMCEHVGYKNYRTFMEVAYNCLKDNGLFLMHTIGGNTSVHSIDPWLGKYIFPNGMLPSVKQLAESFEGLFVMEDWHNFSAHYDKTLMAWFNNFDKNWDKIKLDHNERFYRIWKYYLLCCAGSFRARKNQLWQVVLSKGGVPGGYNSIR